jgi:hypothetical protein
MEMIFGAATVEMGEPREVVTKLLLDALTEALSALDRLPNRPRAFRVQVAGSEPSRPSGSARGVGGLLINGIYFHISCVDDYWRIAPTGGIPQGRRDAVPPGMRGEPRHEPSKIKTDNMKTVTVAPVKSKREGAKKILKQMLDFVSGEETASVTVVIG